HVEHDSEKWEPVCGKDHAPQKAGARRDETNPVPLPAHCCASGNPGNRSGRGSTMTQALPLLEVSDLSVEFATRRGTVPAVQHVDLQVAEVGQVGFAGVSSARTEVRY